MQYHSTRNNYQAVSAAEAIKLGMVPAGGLFVPEGFPLASLDKLRSFSRYYEVARWIMGKYLRDFDSGRLDRIIHQAYGPNFNSPAIAPLVTPEAGLHILELWHGPTAAFKDLALQCMPHLLLYSLELTARVEKVMILVATSGDTGMAALDGFCDKDKIEIVVFYPVEGVSKIQKQQMITKTGSNLRAVGVRGNFDICQTSVKEVFADKTLISLAAEQDCVFSSANSINWGRLLPQIVYYFWAYHQLADRGGVKWGDPVNFCVPTGNFGNILSAYYAREMGLPIAKLICASNKNNILTDFINTGKYDLNRPFHVTSSPSMDILISSNLERFIYDVYGRDGNKVADLYKHLEEKKYFQVEEAVNRKMQNLLCGGSASEEETWQTIHDVFSRAHYLLDTHTAVGYHVAEAYRKDSGDKTPLILTSTANPYKFPKAVYKAVTGEAVSDDFRAVELLHRHTGTQVHPALSDIAARKVLHTDVIGAEEIAAYIRKILTNP